jgi:hypothetical protein
VGRRTFRRASDRCGSRSRSGRRSMRDARLHVGRDVARVRFKTGSSITNAPARTMFGSSEPSARCGVWQLPQPAIVSTRYLPCVSGSLRRLPARRRRGGVSTPLARPERPVQVPARRAARRWLGAIHETAVPKAVINNVAESARLERTPLYRS